MIFSSYTFVLAFLPVTVLLTLAARRWFGIQATMSLLSACSFFFYGYWDWTFLWVIVLSITMNYGFGRLLENTQPALSRRMILFSGIAFNLGMLGYFKYSIFFLELGIAGSFLGSNMSLAAIVLPLGISFFTFQQIAYLVDVHRRETIEHRFLHYVLFVSFFPQLIAGPIVHHKEMMPQFVSGVAGKFAPFLFAQGITIFTVGLVKKVFIADRLALMASPVFDAASTGGGGGGGGYQSRFWKPGAVL